MSEEYLDRETLGAEEDPDDGEALSNPISELRRSFRRIYEAAKASAENDDDEDDEEEVPETVRTEFAPQLPDAFRKLWGITEKWERTSAICHEDIRLLASDTYNTETDGVLSKQTCRRHGEAVLKQAYQEAQDHLKSKSSVNFSQQVCQNLVYNLEDSFAQAKHCVRLLSAHKAIQQELGEIQVLLNFGTFQLEMQKALDEELQNGHVYKLHPFSYYAEQIKVESDDMGLEDGFWRVLETAFARYTYDGSRAYYDLRDDVRDLAEQYKAAAQEHLNRYLVIRRGKRIQELLELVEVKLTNPDIQDALI